MTNYDSLFTCTTTTHANGLIPKSSSSRPRCEVFTVWKAILAQRRWPDLRATALCATSAFLPRTRNVVFVATEHDNVYAFCCGKSTSPIGSEAYRSANGITTAQSSEIPRPTSRGDRNHGTPNHDGSGKTLYVVAKHGENGSYVHRLYALDLPQEQRIRRAGADHGSARAWI